MKKKFVFPFLIAIFLLVIFIFLIIGCVKKETALRAEDFEIKSAKWDSEIEFDCGKCDKPVCRWEMAFELEYKFNPTEKVEEAVCWYYINNRVKIKPIQEKNKITVGGGKISDTDLLIDCWEDYRVGLCCAYDVDKLLKDEYVCKDVLLEALCP